MVFRLMPAHVHHERAHHAISAIVGICELYRRTHRSPKSMNRTVWRVKGLDIIEVVWHGSHFDHLVAIIRCQALDLGSSVS